MIDVVARHRYTEWATFSSGRPNWGMLKGTELYVHNGSAGIAENANVAADPAHAHAVSVLSKMLRSGPTTGGGWGPHSTAYS